MKIGIYGGAFDPLHTQHIKIVEDSRKKLKLDKIILVPSYNPPHKDKNMTSFEDRYSMLKIWAENKPFVLINTIEKEKKLDNSYTAVIVPEIVKEYLGSDSTIYYIIGGDSMVNFHTWHNPKSIASFVDLAVIERKGYDGLQEAINNAKKEYNAQVTLLDIDCKDISSSKLRAKLELGFPLNGEIDKDILDYIEKKGLYSFYKDIVNKAKARVSKELFSHMSRVAIFAVSFAGSLGISFEKAFLAGFLHDIAKEMPPLKDSYPTNSPKVIHQYDGKTVASNDFGINDKDILDAIECHTTGKPQMSNLAKLIYVADKLEKERDFEGIEEIRMLAKKDFQKGFSALVARSYNYLLGLNKPIDNLTKECHKYYN